jgi:hypothetical protein
MAGSDGEAQDILGENLGMTPELMEQVPPCEAEGVRNLLFSLGVVCASSFCTVLVAFPVWWTLWTKESSAPGPWREHSKGGQVHHKGPPPNCQYYSHAQSVGAP